MSNFYRFLQISMTPIVRTFFGEIKTNNYDKLPIGEPIIFVANHPSALMDPLICGAFVEKPIYFLGRADIFKSKFNNWFLRNSHMWPIYRDVDGKDSLEKNKQVFAECYESLKNGNPILLYGEGFTDESFIRRIKKIKKGASRIAFGAEEAFDFELGLSIVPLGINYTNSEKKDSDLMLNFGEPVKLKDYESQFKDNAVKAMLEVTREVETRLLSLVTHIDDKKEADDLENTLSLFDDSVHQTTKESQVPVVERWKKSKKIADALNDWEGEEKETFKTRLNDFAKKHYSGESTVFVNRAIEGKPVPNIEWILLFFTWPVALIGFLLNGLSFYLVQTLPKKLVKRKCFYSGMKVAFTLIVAPLVWLIDYFILMPFVDISPLFPLIVGVGLFTALFALRYRTTWKRFQLKVQAKKHVKSLKDLKSELKELEDLRLIIENKLK
ncbi:1-acyl-sn-glycerol-3-phosphate acyltransferase [Flavobacteriales bacterium]|nr:1-acyl-sn-glycerol-3-phosphate acyltransferase [Flavobacteriales bacterium]